MDMDKEFLEIHLTEYRALRQEEKTRFSTSKTILHLIALIFGGEIVASLLTAIDNKAVFVFTIILILPIITGLLILWHYNNQFQIYQIRRYFSEVFYNRVKGLYTHEVLDWEAFHPDAKPLKMVSPGHNLFFIITIIFPIFIFYFFRPKGAVGLLEWSILGTDIVLGIAVILTWRRLNVVFRT